MLPAPAPCVHRLATPLLARHQSGTAHAPAAAAAAAAATALSSPAARRERAERVGEAEDGDGAGPKLSSKRREEHRAKAEAEAEAETRDPSPSLQEPPLHVSPSSPSALPTRPAETTRQSPLQRHHLLPRQRCTAVGEWEGGPPINGREPAGGTAQTATTAQHTADLASSAAQHRTRVRSPTPQPSSSSHAARHTPPPTGVAQAQCTAQHSTPFPLSHGHSHPPPTSNLLSFLPVLFELIPP